MNCPNCETPEQVRVRVCGTCGTIYASDDLQILRQLEFLLKETADWHEAETRRQPYVQTLAALKARILPTLTAAPIAALNAQAVAPLTSSAQPAVAVEPAPIAREPKTPAVPFDQWLLSEGNIKIALYSGGALLILAGLIFVGINWAYLPGLVKFAITLTITALMYVGGYLLFRRPVLKLGGIALLAIASGFVPLNFVVLQIYLLGERGLSANAMWLITSLFCLLAYALTAWRIREELFTYFSLAALVSAITALMVLANVGQDIFVLIYALLALALLLAARFVPSITFASFTRLPLLIVSQLAAPVLFLVSIALWVRSTGCFNCTVADPRVVLEAMVAIVIFYVVTDRLFARFEARWAAAFMFALTFVFILIELKFSGIATGITLKVLALIYLGVGYALERKADKRTAGLPLYAAGYAVAAFVTLQSLAAITTGREDLAKALLADVILLAVSARVHRRYEWIYGAAWLFIAPVLIYATIYLNGSSNIGLALGALMLAYVAAGYWLGRRALKFGGPFLTAAAFLSVLVIAFTGANWSVTTLALAVIAALYLFVALWLRWGWLLLPALAAVNAAVLTFILIFSNVALPLPRVLILAYAALGVALTIGGVFLRRAGKTIWALPLYLVAAIDVTGAYLAALAVETFSREVVLDRWLVIGLSLGFAVVALALAWLEREAFEKAKLPPLFTFLGAALIFVGELYVLRLTPVLFENGPAYLATLCALCRRRVALAPRVIAPSVRRAAATQWTVADAPTARGRGNHFETTALCGDFRDCRNYLYRRRMEATESESRVPGRGRVRRRDLGRAQILSGP